MITRLAHVCLKTAQFDAMVRFYRDTLGLPVKFTFINKAGDLFGCYFDAGETTFIELFDQAGADVEWGGGTDPLQPNANTFYQHFCFQVDDLDSYRKRLLDAGLEVTDIHVGLDNSRQCWIKDPDGNAIELMEYTPTSKEIQPGHDPGPLAGR
ncbi:MAG: VOC family protein [Verrucomicrobia bacterium]|nr:MAG: VOC family protein [Verrucomicrobiota bacterium]